MILFVAPHTQAACVSENNKSILENYSSAVLNSLRKLLLVTPSDFAGLTSKSPHWKSGKTEEDHHARPSFLRMEQDHNRILVKPPQLPG